MTGLLHTVYLEVIPCSQLLTYQSITCCTHPPCLLSDAEISCLRSHISIFDLAGIPASTWCLTKGQRYPVYEAG
jgi:hypothetical protein